MDNFESAGTSLPLVEFDSFGVFEISDPHLCELVSAGLAELPAIESNVVCLVNGACYVNVPCGNPVCPQINDTCIFNNSCGDKFCV
jgi:hypothetical protein